MAGQELLNVATIGRATRMLLSASVLLGMPVLAGCSKKPGGQVVAVVNSEEITQQELRAEADAVGVAPTQELQSYAPAVLQRVIERNLLADYARKQGLDRGPEFIARRRQLEQSLLANLALRKLARDPGTPTPAEVQAFIKANPAMYQDRQRLALDQVRFATPNELAQIKALAALGSLDAIERKLKADGVRYARGGAVLDTGTVESTVARQMVALPNGQLFDLSTNGVTFISAITGRTPLVTAPASWSQPAGAALQRERAQKGMVEAMKQLRSAAKIEYDPAFKPAAAPKS